MGKIDFTGRVAVVTGAGNGLGRAHAHDLAARGAAVVVNDLGSGLYGTDSSHDRADRVVDEIRASGGKAVASYESVSTAEGGASIIQTAIDAFGKVDIVINNAGNQKNGLFEDMTPEAFESVIASHLKGAFFVSQPAYKYMKAQGYGRILFTSSQSGVFGAPFRANYGAAKAGVIGLMNVIAVEGGDFGIVVNALMPNAMIHRPEAKPAGERADADYLAKMGPKVMALKEGYKPEFVTPLATYLVSDRCTTSQGMYSALGGRFARGFVGMTEGWMSDWANPPSAEDIEAHWSQIEDARKFNRPHSGMDEVDDVLRLIEEMQK